MMPSDGRVKAVLELKAGQVQKRDIAVGDRVTYRYIKRTDKKGDRFIFKFFPTSAIAEKINLSPFLLLLIRKQYENYSCT